jgi:hypothetical protein
MQFVRLAVMVVVLAAGCTETMEERKAAFEEQMQPEVGVKPKDYYLDAWDLPANRETLKDGGEAVTWEWRSADGRMGWQKTLVFSSDGMLREYRWTHWPRR